MYVWGLLAGVLGLTTLLLYYILVWLKVGRDLRKGVIIPLYSPPDNMSPPEMRFFMRMGYDKLCLTALIIHMKILNVVDIQKIGETISLTLTGNNEDRLSNIDREIKENIFKSESSVPIGKIDDSEIGKIIEKGILEKYGSQIFKTNRSYSMKGFAMILIIFILTALFSRNDLAIIFIVFLEIWGIFLTLLFFGMIEAWKMVYYGFESRAGAILVAVLITLMELAFSAPVIIMMIQVIKSGAWIVVLQIPVAVTIYFIFYELLKVRTDVGWKIMDHMEGFKMFLRASEESRLELLASEGIKHFEFDTYLPYAMALGVYKEEWARRFKHLYEGGMLDK